MAKRSEHTQEELKELVLSAAEAIVTEEGFSALKVRRIAAEIGYTVGSIYMVFTNMADLTVHINAKTLDAISAQLEQVQATHLKRDEFTDTIPSRDVICPDLSGSPQVQVQECSAEQIIEALAIAYLTYASANFTRWHTIFNSVLISKTEIPDWYQEKVTAVFSHFERPFTELAPDLCDDHRKRVARALWYSIHGICTLSLTGQDDKSRINDIEQTLILLIRNFMSGWRKNSI
jgi:AcrR family transcriptional regulator